MPFAGNVIPGNRMDPAALQILGFLPTARRSAGDRYTALGNNTYLIPAPYNEAQYDIKIDHQFTPSQRTMFRYSRWDIERKPDSHTPRQFVRHIQSGRHWSWRGPRNSFQYMLAHTWTVSPKAIADFRVGYTRYASIQAWLTGCQPLFDSCQTPFDPPRPGCQTISASIRHTGLSVIYVFRRVSGFGGG